VIRVLILWLALAGGARAEEIVMGLSESRVAITATFDGSDILVFGAVKRDGPAPDPAPLEVIISVSGPATPVVVRRKERRFGLWVNVDEVEVDSAPSFYAVATTGPLRDILTDVEDLRHQISIPRAIRSVGNRVTDSAAFTEALVRIRAGEGLFRVMEGAVLFSEETLFRVQIGLPANLIEGNYDTRIYLTRNGQVVDSFETLIAVRKVGIERWLYNLARDLPLAYAALALALAIVAGWSASALFQFLRR
jgi:uncharacterized protein (TIGR02186 family)